MLSSSVSKQFSSPEDLDSALEACNAVFELDFGPGHRLNAGNAPDILMMTKNKEGSVTGVVGLHYYPENRAWELGTVAAAAPRSHARIMDFLVEKEAPFAIRRWYGEGDAWLVKRLKQANTRLQASLRATGFELPAHFMIGIMDDDGYVPFDPLDEVLMKKKIVFAVDP